MYCVSISMASDSPPKAAPQEWHQTQALLEDGRRGVRHADERGINDLGRQTPVHYLQNTDGTGGTSADVESVRETNSPLHISLIQPTMQNPHPENPRGQSVDSGSINERTSLARGLPEWASVQGDLHTFAIDQRPGSSQTLGHIDKSSQSFPVQPAVNQLQAKDRTSGRLVSEISQSLDNPTKEAAVYRPEGWPKDLNSFVSGTLQNPNHRADRSQNLMKPGGVNIFHQSEVPGTSQSFKKHSGSTEAFTRQSHALEPQVDDTVQHNHVRQVLQSLDEIAVQSQGHPRQPMAYQSQVSDRTASILAQRTLHDLNERAGPFPKLYVSQTANRTGTNQVSGTLHGLEGSTGSFQGLPQVHLFGQTINGKMSNSLDVLQTPTLPRRTSSQSTNEAQPLGNYVAFPQAEIKQDSEMDPKDWLASHSSLAFDESDPLSASSHLQTHEDTQDESFQQETSLLCDATEGNEKSLSPLEKPSPKADEWRVSLKRSGTRLSLLVKGDASCEAQMGPFQNSEDSLEPNTKYTKNSGAFSLLQSNTHAPAVPPGLQQEMPPHVHNTTPQYQRVDVDDLPHGFSVRNNLPAQAMHNVALPAIVEGTLDQSDQVSPPPAVLLLKPGDSSSGMTSSQRAVSEKPSEPEDNAKSSLASEERLSSCSESYATRSAGAQISEKGGLIVADDPPRVTESNHVHIERLPQGVSMAHHHDWLGILDSPSFNYYDYFNSHEDNKAGPSSMLDTPHLSPLSLKLLQASKMYVNGTYSRKSPWDEERENLQLSPKAFTSSSMGATLGDSISTSYSASRSDYITGERSQSRLAHNETSSSPSHCSRASETTKKGAPFHQEEGEVNSWSASLLDQGLSSSYGEVSPSIPERPSEETWPPDRVRQAPSPAEISVFASEESEDRFTATFHSPDKSSPFSGDQESPSREDSEKGPHTSTDRMMEVPAIMNHQHIDREHTHSDGRGGHERAQDTDTRQNRTHSKSSNKRGKKRPHSRERSSTLLEVSPPVGQEDESTVEFPVVDWKGSHVSDEEEDINEVYQEIMYDLHVEATLFSKFMRGGQTPSRRGT